MNIRKEMVSHVKKTPIVKTKHEIPLFLVIQNERGGLENRIALFIPLFYRTLVFKTESQKGY